MREVVKIAQFRFGALRSARSAISRTLSSKAWREAVRLVDHREASLELTRIRH
ncbi:hypothetical protein ABOZ73_04790 [Caulobacter sp. 73W]|uniref:Uncharacterized protein n=1 Tax=Caulobacter sp. 73W TaxID=3161137 RepID=A0AB39KVB9_9CAUL